jgi:MYXO-CTERM domain-containing protein
MKIPAFTRLLKFLLLLALVQLIPLRAHAVVVEDWGTMVTPLTQDVTFEFAQYDLTHNFTHDYTFSLTGGAGAEYAVTFNFDPCNRGCGNPSIEYGIYDATGGLVGTTAGTYVLAAGDYSFQVKGTGMGSGNSADYWGSVTFSTAMVSAAPEPAAWAMTLAGLAAVVLYSRRRQSEARPRRAGTPRFKPLASLGGAGLVALTVTGCDDGPPMAAHKESGSMFVNRLVGDEIVAERRPAASAAGAPSGSAADRGFFDQLFARKDLIHEAVQQKFRSHMEQEN